jgi:thymidine kinase
MKEIDIYDRLPREEFSSTFLRLREQGRLDERLSPSPVEVADALAHTISTTKIPTVHIVHALSMFSGKTSSIIGAASILQKEGTPVFAFQPGAAHRYDGQEVQIISNGSEESQKLKFPAKVIDNNDLFSVIELAREFLNSNGQKQTIVIDDAQLFISQNGKPEEAIQAISELQKLGFDVIVSGITRTFEGKPFTFMQDLVDYASDTFTWNAVEMSSLCACCDKKAKGTRRYVSLNGDDPRIAKLGERFDVAGGSKLYIPVCMDEHLSFSE